MARTKIPGTKPTLKEVLGSASDQLVLKLPPFDTLTAKQGAEIVSYMRFPNDPRNRREVLSAKSLKLSASELLALARADQLLTTLDGLERMEKHYLEVSKLDTKEVQRRLEASDPDDLGALGYKWCLTEEGADPRQQIAERILSLIPIARRNLETGKPALELNEIFMLNDRANMWLIAPHLRRGLNNLAAGRAGGRRQNPAGKETREAFAFEFLRARKVRPSLTQREFTQGRNPAVSLKTLQRGLKDLKSSPV
jgi:hypothetical protein